MAASKMLHVRATMALASLSSRRCLALTFFTPRISFLVRTAGGPRRPSVSDRKSRLTEKVEHGGAAKITRKAPDVASSSSFS